MFRTCLIFIGLFTFYWSKCYGAEEGMPQLNPDFWVSQIFWLFLIFGSLYLILWKVILPKISENLENRKVQILSDLESAQKSKDESEKKITEYNKILDQAKNEAKNILNEARKKINSDIETKKNKFNLEIEKEIEKAEKEIKTLKQSSINDINQIASVISAEIVKQLIGSEANKSSIAAIVEDISKKKITKYL